MKLIKKEDVTDVVPHEVETMEVETDPAGYARLGWLIVVLGFGGFMLWALFAPLDKGVPLSGTVTMESNRQAVQHQTGGTIQDILVRDGDKVKKGQVLLRMNSVVAKSTADASRAQYLSGLAVEARLIAERDGLKKLTFPEELNATPADPRASEIKALQNQLFSSRQSSIQSELSAIDENIQGLKVSITAFQESKESKVAQATFLKEQLAGMRDLAKEGYVARNRLLELERTYAQINGSISEDMGQIGRAQRQVMELNLRRIQRSQDYQKEVRSQLTDVQRELNVLKERLVGQEFELANVDVRSPADGTIVGMNVFTKGGVVGPGFKLMDVLPSGDSFVVEGQLAVNLVDKVQPGLKVDFMFSAFNMNTTPHIPGVITQVSADRTVEERTGAPYYKVRAKVTPEGMQLIAKNKLDVQAGMPVDLFVKTGERTMMNYLIRPVLDRIKTSLTEE